MNNLRKQSIVNTIGIVVYLFADWLILMLLPRLYGYEYAGAYSYSFSVASIFYCIAVFSMRNFQVVDAYRKYSEESYFSAQVLLVLIAIILSIIYKRVFYSNSIYGWLFYLCMAQQMLSALCTPIFAALQIKERLDLAGMSGFVSGVSKVALFALAYTLGLDFSRTIIIAIAGSILIYVLYSVISFERIYCYLRI